MEWGEKRVRKREKKKKALPLCEIKCKKMEGERVRDPNKNKRL